LQTAAIDHNARSSRAIVSCVESAQLAANPFALALPFTPGARVPRLAIAASGHSALQHWATSASELRPCWFDSVEFAGGAVPEGTYAATTFGDLVGSLGPGGEPGVFISPGAQVDQGASVTDSELPIDELFEAAAPIPPMAPLPGEAPVAAPAAAPGAAPVAGPAAGPGVFPETGRGFGGSDGGGDGDDGGDGGDGRGSDVGVRSGQAQSDSEEEKDSTPFPPLALVGLHVSMRSHGFAASLHSHRRLPCRKHQLDPSGSRLCGSHHPRGADPDCKALLDRHGIHMLRVLCLRSLCHRLWQGLRAAPHANCSCRAGVSHQSRNQGQRVRLWQLWR
jgi:hypothetical protein